MPIISDFKRELASQSPPAFGRWMTVDLHNHSPSSFDYEGNRETAAADTAARLRETDVAIVMFTDHDELPPKTFTDEVAKLSGRTVLRGVELNVFVDVFDKPKGKVDKQIFFHLLIGFDPHGDQAPEYWLAHLNKECKREERVIGGNKVGGLTASVDAICETLQSAGAIVIPAHLHKAKNAFKSRSVDDIYSDPEFLRLARERFTALEVTDLATAAYFDGKHNETENLLKTCIRSSDAHLPETIGTRVTHVLMENPTFSELRASLQIPFRVSLIEPSVPESYILGLNIRGQFYPDLWLSMSEHCNAFIGVKGSGKTSVLECLRFALGSPVPASRQGDVNNHLQSILGVAGTVRVLVIRKDGAEVLIERANNGTTDFKMTFGDDRQVIVQNPDALMFPSYILGWHEIEQAATDPNIRQVYLDTIAGREQIRQLQESADTKANQIQQLHGQVTARYTTYRALGDQVARLDDLRAGLQELSESNLIGLRDSYDVAVRQREAFNGLRQSVREMAANIETRGGSLRLATETSALEGDSVLSEFAARALVELHEINKMVSGLTEEYRDSLDSAANKLDAEHEALEIAFSAFTRTYADSVSQLSPDKQRLLETHRQVMEDTKALSRLQAELATERTAVEDLLHQLESLCDDVADALDEQTNLREQRVAQLNNQLIGFGVKLEVAPLARRTIFDDLGSRYANGAEIMSHLSHIAADERRHHRRVARTYASLRKDLQSGASLIFRTSDFSVYLHAFEQDDLSIRFAVGKDGEEFSPIDQLSAGQRCTAVFPLLLKLREGPLIVDQPEDNLDNRHIAESIAPALLEDKSRRQIAFTSHNANLVVLTDAEQVVMFEATGSQGRAAARGFLCTSHSTITPEVIAILDGGQNALELRYKKYGFRPMS